MMVAGTYLRQPANLYYIVLYTISFSTLFYWLLWPFDLLLINAACQIPCYVFTRNTFHGFIAGQFTEISRTA